MKPALLSVILPSIRPERIPAWMASLDASYQAPWELIVVSPSPVSGNLIAPQNVQRLRWIQDWGNPVRCQQIGLAHCEGDIVHRAVDDSLYLPGQMDRAVAMLTEDHRLIIAPKYTETNASVDRSHKDFQDMRDPKFYDIRYHNQAGSEFCEPHWKLLNFGILHADYLRWVGGWDCRFESVAIAELDLAVRLQMAGGMVALTDDLVLECDWMPGHEGDHGPMHDAFAPDMERYREIYSTIACRERIWLDLNNWKQSPPKWERRFGK